MTQFKIQFLELDCSFNPNKLLLLFNGYINRLT